MFFFSQFKSIIKPTPISTAIKLSEPQINLAEREILLEYSDQYCSPGLAGALGTLKAFGSASSLGGKRALHQAYQYSNPGEEEVPQRGEDRLSTLSFFRSWSLSGAALLTSNWHWQSDSGSVSGAEGCCSPVSLTKRMEMSVKHETRAYYTAIRKRRHWLLQCKRKKNRNDIWRKVLWKRDLFIRLVLDLMFVLLAQMTSLPALITKPGNCSAESRGGGGGGGQGGGGVVGLPGTLRYFAAHSPPSISVDFISASGVLCLPEHTGGAHSATWAELNGLWSKGLIKRRHTTCPLALHFVHSGFAGENDAGQVSYKSRRFAANNRRRRRKEWRSEKRKGERGWWGHKVWALNCAVGRTWSGQPLTEGGAGFT